MVQATNLLRALRQNREAGALGLLEGQAQRSSTLGDALVNASRDASLRRRAQSLQRFMLQQLHREGAPAGALHAPFSRYASQLGAGAEQTVRLAGCSRLRLSLQGDQQ